MNEEQGSCAWTCPISLEPLAGLIGLTVLGSACQLEALHVWLSEHDTDPITGERLPSKFIVRHNLETYGGPVESERDKWARLRDRQQHLRRSTNLWTMRRDYSVDPELQARIRTCAQFAQEHFYQEPLWKEYEDHVCGLLKHCPLYMVDLQEVDALRAWRTYYLRHLASVIPVPIPIFPADNFFVGVRVSHHVLVSKPNFKGWHFNGADFRGVSCSAGFPQCKFICADLRGTRFVAADFSGEHVNFTGALVNDQTTFAACDIEKEATWTPLTRLEDKAEEFHRRGVGPLAQIL